MRLTYLQFSYEDTTIPWPYREIAQYNDYCNWLGTMYQFYLKPVITDKMRTLCVIVTDNMNHDGTVELDSFQKSYNHNVFRLGLCYYYGEEIAANKEKGLVLIKEAAGMGSNSAHEWLAYPHWRKTWWG